MTKMFAEQIKDLATLEPYYGGTLFKQGTELVALERGNLAMGNIAPQDISNQIPAWSVLTSAYLFRDAAHLKTFFDSELGAVWYTASAEAQAYRDACQRAAEETIANDPFVNSMIRELDAWVVPGTIVPPQTGAAAAA